MLEPSYITRLKHPDIKNILMVGCGGGFDFVHGMLLYPTLIELGKNVIIGSYSFGLITNLPIDSQKYESQSGIEVRIVNGNMAADEHYAPEINLCAYLDEKYPHVSHEVFAYYARDCTVTQLTTLYQEFCQEYEIDSIIAFDGGSDSLMVGDEAGVGDIVEDLVSLTAISKLKVKERILINVGIGTDRYNDVSDASTLRAVAEITQLGGYLGCSGIEPNSEEHVFYRDAIEFIMSRQSFRSKVSGFILSSIEGFYSDSMTKYLPFPKHKEGAYHIWPLMAILWAFDIDSIVRRTKVSEAIENQGTVVDTWKSISTMRQGIVDSIRSIENLPRHEDMRRPEQFDFTTGRLDGGWFESAIELEELE